MRKKKPRFFCDGCGAEVTANAERCPRCGKFFASIRCPRCGFIGGTDTFSKGCPACGYSAPRSARGSQRQSKPDPRATVPEGPVALWLYAVGIALLAMLMTALFMCVTR
ncbi:MAG: zinc ribbon domain-containing protein [Spirochaetaceae bacterium]|nr:zinc ribbon domain-containing protein [Spirochaetaceae bacterium]